MILTVRDLAAALATVDPDTPVTAGIDIPADTLAEWGWDVPLYVDLVRVDASAHTLDLVMEPQP